MLYSEYRTLPEIRRYTIYDEFLKYNQHLQKKAQLGWRPMTEEEKKWADEVGKKKENDILLTHKLGD